MKPIIFPNSLDLEGTLNMIRKLRDVQPGEDYLFDFRKVRWIGPFGLVMLSTCLEDAVERAGRERCFVTGHQSQGYMSHVGFFRAFGCGHGNSPGQAKGSSSYLPITDLDCVEYYKLSASGGIALGEQMEEQAKRIVSVLLQKVEGDVFDTLVFTTREMLRNALEHSQTKTIRFCAQFLKGTDQVEVAILDHGRGVRESLSTNPFIECQSDKQAINHALMPGVSGTAFKGSKRMTGEKVWQNSGYGLYMTSRLCRLGGSFFIGSHSASLSISRDGKVYHEFGFAGTCVRLIMKPSQVSNVSSRLKEFAAEGKAIAERQAGTIVKASTASQMVTSDYQ